MALGFFFFLQENQHMGEGCGNQSSHLIVRGGTRTHAPTTTSGAPFPNDAHRGGYAHEGGVDSDDRHLFLPVYVRASVRFDDERVEIEEITGDEHINRFRETWPFVWISSSRPSSATSSSAPADVAPACLRPFSRDKVYIKRFIVHRPHTLAYTSTHTHTHTQSGNKSQHFHIHKARKHIAAAKVSPVGLYI